MKSHVNNLVRHSTNGLFEKSDIKWMTFDDLRKERGTFRSYYRNVVDVILENEDDIASKLLQNKKQRKRFVVAVATGAAATATGATATVAHKTRRYNNYKYSNDKAELSKPHKKSKKRHQNIKIKTTKSKPEPAHKKWFQLW